MSQLFGENSNSFACRPLANEIFNDFVFISNQYGELKVVLCGCGKVYIEQKLQDSLVRSEELNTIYHEDPEFFLVLYKAIFEHAKKKSASDPHVLQDIEDLIPHCQKEITGE